MRPSATRWRGGTEVPLWFEPERVAGGTYIAKEHRSGSSVEQTAGCTLGIPSTQVHDDYLNTVIKEYKLTCLRIDYNIDPLGAWQSMDAKDPNRVGMAEMRYSRDSTRCGTTS